MAKLAALLTFVLLVGTLNYLVQGIRQVINLFSSDDKEEHGKADGLPRDMVQGIAEIFRSDDYNKTTVSIIQVIVAIGSGVALLGIVGTCMKNGNGCIQDGLSSPQKAGEGLMMIPGAMADSLKEISPFN